MSTLLRCITHNSRFRYGHFLQIVRHESRFERFNKNMNEKVKRLQEIREKEKQSQITKPISREEYTVIYDYRGVKFSSSIVKLQKPFMIIAIAGVPVFYYFERTGTFSIFFLCLCLYYIFFMRLLGHLLKNLVGKIYIKNTKPVTEVIISSMNINGQRVNRSHDPKNLCYYGPTSRFTKFMGFSRMTDTYEDIEYKLSLKNFKSNNKKIFYSVIGSRED